MKVAIVLVWTSVIAYISLVRTAISTGHAFHVSTLDNLMFEDQYFIREDDSISRIKCTLACYNMDLCVSCTFNNFMRKCRLHSSGFYHRNEGIVQSNWTYYNVGEPWCPLSDGFVHERPHGLCIHFTAQLFSGYTNAKAYCQAKHASVVSLPTANKSAHFTNVMEKINTQFLVANGFGSQSQFHAYIGLIKKGGTWKWEDGSSFGTYLNWGPSQPNCPCQCGAVAKLGIWNWEWKDRQCDSLDLSVICEFP